MKRFLTMTTIVAVVLAMTAGPAVASACSGTACTPTMSCCVMGTTSACAMDMGPSVSAPGCDHQVKVEQRDGVASAPVANDAVVAVPFAHVALAPATLDGFAPASPPDARGAPHLTAVIRI